MFTQQLDRIVPGDVLARTLYSQDGRPLLMEGTELDDRYLRLLRERGYTTLPLADGLADDVQPRALISPEVRTTVSEHVATTFSRIAELAGERGLTAGSVDDTADGFGERALPLDDGDELLDLLYADVDLLITEILETDTVAGLESLKRHNEYTFQHSVDVAVVGLLLGKRLRMPRSRLRELALGCLLHDLGKIYVDRAILDKPGPLSGAEFTAVEQHPRMGYELVRRMPVASLLPAHVAYQHHERQNGRGYPRGLVGGSSVRARIRHEQIGAGQMLLIAEIGAVADVFSALSSDRPYRTALSPDRVIASLREMSPHHLHHELIDLLQGLVPSYPVGTWVVVQGGPHHGCRGVVSGLHRRNLHRPRVRLLLDARGDVLPAATEIESGEFPGVTLRCLPAGQTPTGQLVPAS